MPLEGMQIGRYRFVRLLGSGGMGEVYLAEDARIGQQVAIKVIRSEASSYPNDSSTKEATRLFQREAMAIAKLDHPYILPLFDYGEGNINGVTLTYLVMPFRHEGSLVDWLRRQGSSALLSSQDVANIVGQTADALQHAHDRQIIHQDVKPSNLLIRERKETPNRPDVLLADFGIAKVASATASSSHVIRGTPTYMAPEQWEAHPLAATDQYALAVMAYELLTGRPPFQGGSMQMMYQHFNTQPQPPSALNEHVSADVDDVLLHALEKKPQDRFDTISTFATALQKAIQSTEASALISSQPETSPKLTPHITASPSGTNANGLVDPTLVHVQPQPPSVPSTQVLSEQIPEETVILKASASSAVEGNVVGNTPSTGNVPPPAVKRGGPHRRIGRRWLAVVLLLIAAFVVFASIAYASPGTFTSLVKYVFGSSNPPMAADKATVTITPKSVDLTKTYTITAVTAAPDASKHQVQARPLYSTTLSQYKKVNASGSTQIAAVQAKGKLYVYNNGCSDVNYPIGTVFTGKNDGIQVVTDELAYISDRCVNGTLPPASVSVAAHAVKAGVSGNIQPQDIFDTTNDPYGYSTCPTGTAMSGTKTTNGTYRSSNMLALQYTSPLSGGGYSFVCNPNAFTGGQDASTQSVVQQSDVDSAANALEIQYTPDPKQVLQDQIQPNEQFIDTPQCKPNVNPNHKAGDTATSVTVGVSFTCTGEVYDHNGVLTMAEQWLKQDAAKDPGTGYELVGNVAKTQTDAKISDANQGTISVSVATEGVWVFQFSDAQKQTLTRLIAGKKKEEAQPLLLQQTGVAQDTMQLTGGDRDTLPTNISQITFVVSKVTGK